MAWISRAPELQPAVAPARVPVPVPDIERLRRAALQASWRRDRRVARRRTFLRWALWYGLRGLPLLLLAAAVSIWLLPQIVDRLAAPDSKRKEPGIQLKLEIPIQPAPPELRSSDPGSPDTPSPNTSAPAVLPNAADAAAAVAPTLSPQLKPDN